MQEDYVQNLRVGKIFFCIFFSIFLTLAASGAQPYQQLPIPCLNICTWGKYLDEIFLPWENIWMKYLYLGKLFG